MNPLDFRMDLDQRGGPFCTGTKWGLFPLLGRFVVGKLKKVSDFGPTVRDGV